MEKSPERAQKLLIWIQTAIKDGYLRNPGIVGVKWLNNFLKGYNIKPYDLRRIGADHASRVHGGHNDSHRMILRSIALRHSPDGPHSSAEHYGIMNDRN